MCNFCRVREGNSQCLAITARSWKWRDLAASGSKVRTCTWRAQSAKSCEIQGFGPGIGNCASQEPSMVLRRFCGSSAKNCGDCRRLPCFSKLAKKYCGVLQRFAETTRLRGNAAETYRIPDSCFKRPTFICMYIYIERERYVYIYIYAHTYIHMYIYICIYHTHIICLYNICVYIYICIRICIYIYIYRERYIYIERERAHSSRALTPDSQANAVP